MIGVFDSGHGGLTVFRALVERFPDRSFTYLGDHGNAPYGDRPAAEVLDLTRVGVERLFERGSRLVLLGCNTATAVSSRYLQHRWLPESGWVGHNVLGIVAPTVEAATQTAWGVTTPQYPQKYNDDVVAVFGTTRTIASGVYAEEIRKRCPRVTVLGQSVPGLAGAIERSAPDDEIDTMIAEGVGRMLDLNDGEAPHRAILGCTHFPLVEDVFRRPRQHPGAGTAGCRGRQPRGLPGTAPRIRPSDAESPGHPPHHGRRRPGPGDRRGLLARRSGPPRRVTGQRTTVGGRGR